VLKHRRSVYRPGTRSRVWWKAKHKLVLPVEVLACAPELVEWSDWGQAAVMAFAYRARARASWSPSSRRCVSASPMSVPRRDPAEILCRGVLRSGLLRHPVLVKEGRRDT
jgi:hypothetical protein